MFGRGEREGEVLERMDEIYYLKCILEKQGEILGVIKSVDDNIVKYFGEEYELKEKELNQRIRDAKFNKEQFDVFVDTISYVKAKHAKVACENNK